MECVVKGFLAYIIRSFETKNNTGKNSSDNAEASDEERVMSKRKVLGSY